MNKLKIGDKVKIKKYNSEKEYMKAAISKNITACWDYRDYLKHYDRNKHIIFIIEKLDRHYGVYVTPKISKCYDHLYFFQVEKPDYLKIKIRKLKKLIKQ